MPRWRQEAFHRDYILYHALYVVLVIFWYIFISSATQSDSLVFASVGAGTNPTSTPAEPENFRLRRAAVPMPRRWPVPSCWPGRHCSRAVRNQSGRRSRHSMDVGAGTIPNTPTRAILERRQRGGTAHRGAGESRWATVHNRRGEGPFSIKKSKVRWFRPCFSCLISNYILLAFSFDIPCL